MNTDVYAGPLRSRSSGARVAFASAVRSMLGHGARTAESVDAALAADPELAPALALRAFALRSLGQTGVLPQARALASAAREAHDPSDPRERALVEAVTRWCDDDGPGAADALDAQLAQEPRDLLLAKLSHGLRFMLGDTAGMLRSAERALEGFGAPERERGWLLGCLAFSLSESGDLSAAERAGRDAVAREPEDAWAVHAVAHVLFLRRDHVGGARWLAEHRGALANVNNFAGHVAWHEALCLVELGRTADALGVLDRRVTIYSGEDYREVSNACALLVRLEQRGCDVGSRWSRWVELARARVGDHGSPFADAHYALALRRRGKRGEAAAFLCAMREALAEREGHDAQVGREVGVPLVEALVDGRADRMRAMRHQLARLGGSRAQRALFDWLCEPPRAARVAAEA